MMEEAVTHKIKGSDSIRDNNPLRSPDISDQHNENERTTTQTKACVTFPKIRDLPGSLT